MSSHSLNYSERIVNGEISTWREVMSVLAFPGKGGQKDWVDELFLYITR